MHRIQDVHRRRGGREHLLILRDFMPGHCPRHNGDGDRRTQRFLPLFVELLLILLRIAASGALREQVAQPFPRVTAHQEKPPRPQRSMIRRAYCRRENLPQLFVVRARVLERFRGRSREQARHHSVRFSF
jgi:hypothetical protein